MSLYEIPLTTLDGRPIGDGRPGPVALALRAGVHEVTEMSLPVLPARA